MRIRIDPNVRVRNNWTIAGFEDCDSDIRGTWTMVAFGEYVGQQVIAYEEESGTEWWARIADIDYHKELIFLAVQWQVTIQPAGETHVPVD